jgi:hypothetical protein
LSEILVVMDTPIRATDGSAYAAQVCGRETEDGHWEGWIEFHPATGDIPLRTSRETTQPNRRTLEHWATGLTSTYMEGALERALRPEPPIAGRPTYDGPAPPASMAKRGAPASPPDALLDPFEAYAHHGEDILLRELGAMDERHLRTIARAHHLGTEEQLLRAPDRRSLALLIVAEVRSRLHPGI